MLTAKEVQDLKTSTRKLQLEVEEKNEIINVLKDELVTLREQSDKFQKENIQLIKDAKRVKFLQDENDFLQDKVGAVELLELEIKRLKEKLNESEFFKIRVKELEEDLNTCQSESSQFKTQLQEADNKLTRVPELEQELSKWKSFSNELEQEKNSLQNKLIESIDHETKLNSINKKVEDEVKRLRDLIKSYEEERDEEQASSSLIMSVADLKQLDLAEQQRNQSVDVGTDPPNADVQDRGHQTDIKSDTADKSVGTDPLPEPSENAVADAASEDELLALDSENKTLKEEVKKQEARATSIAVDNKRIRDELDSNRKMISDLRQDLACEKSLAKKLNTQLASFTKQIKSLDKQYFPIHDTNGSTRAGTRSSSILPAGGDVSKNNPTRSDDLTTPTQTESSKSKSQHANEPPKPHPDESQVSIGTNGNQSITARLRSSATATSEMSSSRCVVFDSNGDSKRRESQTSAGVRNKALPATTRVPKSSTSANIDDKDEDQKEEGNQDEDNDEEDAKGKGDSACKIDNLSKTRSAKSKSFVRNSLPSRSVNYGHSRMSTYLDRIRASVTATTTTNSSSSFSEQSAVKNIMVTSQQQQHHHNGSGEVARSLQRADHVLNCMLDHQHSERCFVVADAAQAALPERNSRSLMPQEAALYGHHMLHQQHAHNLPDVAPSRQLNALIDPVAHEQLMMGLLQNQMAHPGQPNANVTYGPHLTEQQVAHLNNLHRQHYFHHLHQLHQMHHQHHLHHLHHMNHNCAQQQPQINTNVGSQFYAQHAKYDQVYSNTATMNNGTNQIKEQQQQSNGTKLVSKNNEKHRQTPVSSQQPVTRVSPQRMSSVYYQMNNNLAQIDEVNGLPTVHDHTLASKKVLNHKRFSSTRSDTLDRVTGNGQANQVVGSTISPVSLSSPTSSRTSSNISPSSESSSSSGTNSSLAPSAAPLTRSALRHTTTELSRRQFSVERDLVNTAPMTATLSRVNNCDSATPSLIERNSPSKETNQMRNPVQSQQPPMRTSKILNIGQQVSNGHSSLVASKTTNGNADRISKINSNLANMKLNDNLAFSSLRVPKKSSSGVCLNNTFVADTSVSRRRVGAYDSGTKQVNNSPSNPVSKLRVSGGSAQSTGSPTNNSNNNSSVWFEYGCI